MAQAIVTVLILLIFVAYAVFFSLWNAATISIVGWGFWPQEMGAELPVFVVPLAGVVVGAIVMAIAIGAPWSSLKSKLNAAEDQLSAERTRMKECARKVEALKKRLRETQVGSSSTEIVERPPVPEDDMDEDGPPDEDV